VITRSLGGAAAWFTDRHGGVSVAPFDSCNLARHVEDDPAAVAENHGRVLAAAGAPDAAWVQPHHVHGTTVLAVQDGTRDQDEGDGAATARPGLALVAIGADCAPIAIANDTACAAVHAGWRGAVDGVVAAGVAAVRALGKGPVRAVVGPCVCARHYEFGADLLGELTARVGPHLAATTTDGRPAFDLRATLVTAFAREDVNDVEVLDVCTVESPDHYSYRRDGRTGRHGVVVLRNP
jgi:YfiH family protein